MPIFSASYSGKDAFNRTATRRFQVEAVDFATAQSLVAAFVGAIGTVSDLKINKEKVWFEAQVTSVVGAGANVDEGMTVSCEIGGIPGKKGTMKIPAPIKSKINSDGFWDLTDVDVAAFIVLLTAGDIRISDGEIVDTVLSGYLDK